MTERSLEILVRVSLAFAMLYAVVYLASRFGAHDGVTIALSRASGERPRPRLSLPKPSWEATGDEKDSI